MILFFKINLHAQLQIVSTNFNGIGYNTPLFYGSTVNNSGDASNAIMEIRLTNAAGIELIYCQTNPFYLAHGTTVFNGNEFSINQVSVSSLSAAQYIASSGMLPSGLFTYCMRIYTNNSEGDDENCKDIENNSIMDLLLIYPYNEDSIYDFRPTLVWNHTESFGILSQGEYFKLVLTEIQNGQSPEAAISTNTPLFFINNLLTHQVAFPTDANSLEAGKSYAWQVSKFSGNNILQSSDVWKFSIPLNNSSIMKYVILERENTGPVYLLKFNKLYFRFDERYNPGSTFKYKIKDFSGIAISSGSSYIDTTGYPGYTSGAVKYKGYNQFELDFSQTTLEDGIYSLEIFDELNRKYYLKFKP